MKFTKMHGLGNDFILTEQNSELPSNMSPLAVTLCDRRLGIGADGLVIVHPSVRASVRMQIFNADGSEPDMCGNAIRCFSKYVYERGIVSQTTFEVETGAGIMVPELTVRDGRVASVRVNMGKPDLERAHIPMTGSAGHVVDESLSIGSQVHQITSLLMGVPHTQIFVDDVEDVELDALGPAIEKHERFPKGTNVNFIQVINPTEVKVRTWERGAGATLACGTGSCASVVSGVLNRLTDRNVTVHLRTGHLEIEWTSDDIVYMTGPATEVFTGIFTID